MKRWDQNQKKFLEATDIDLFIDDVIAVCKKHNMSLAHEDEHGAFLIFRAFDGGNEEWLRNALVGRSIEAKLKADG